MPVNPAACDLEAIGRELYAEFHAAHPERDLRLQITGDLLGQWDADRLRQAISNLLGNALQHVRRNSPLRLLCAGTPAMSLSRFINGGQPISEGEMPRIFDPLVRGSSAGEAKANRPGSIGMGLYIAREVAKSHHGEITVISTKQAEHPLRYACHDNPAPPTTADLGCRAHRQHVRIRYRSGSQQQTCNAHWPAAAQVIPLWCSQIVRRKNLSGIVLEAVFALFDPIHIAPIGRVKNNIAGKIRFRSP